MGALQEFVRRLKPKECHVYLEGQQYICYFSVFLYHCCTGEEYTFDVHVSS